MKIDIEYDGFDLDDLMDVEQTMPENRVMITDDKYADWALQRIAAAEAECRRLSELADAEIDRYTAKRQRIVETCNRRTEFLRERLAEYFATVPHRSTKTTERYALLSGELVSKRVEPKLEYDEDALCDWLAENDYDDYIKVEPSVKWGEFKKNLLVVDGKVRTGSGEAPPITATPQPDKFEVKLR